MFRLISETAEASEGQPRSCYFLAPPTIRTTPEWYSALQPRVTRLLYKHLKEQQPRLQPLPAFIMDASGLDSDGFHFNATTGFVYAMHLIDKARLVLQ